MNQKIAVLGCGNWGKNLVRNFHSLGALALVCDPTESGRAAAKQIAPAIEIVDKMETVLENSRIDAVAIAVPAPLHYKVALAALLAGKDVYVEKPLCLDLQEAEHLVQMADKLGKILMVGHLLQYHPCVQALQSMVAQGELGKLHYVTSNRLNLGKIRTEENSLWSFAPHDISVILSLASGQMPNQVRCSGGEYLNQSVADTTLTLLRFPGGMRAHIFVSWLNPFKEQKLTVVGSSGMAVFDDTKPWAEKLTVFRRYLTWTDGQIPTANKIQGELVAVPESEALRNECEHFLSCCRERWRPRTDAREGLRVLSVLQAAQRSLDGDGAAVDPGATLPAARDYFAHASAFVDEGAIIGKGTKIWHGAHVMKSARIGQSCILGQNVNVDGGTVIGNNVKIQNNVSVYTGTIIEDDVFLGPSCVLTNVSNPRSQVNRHSLYETTTLKRGATIGANATIVCGVTIGRYAFVAAGAVVTKDVPDYGLVMGNPARHSGWMSRHGHKLKLDAADGIAYCPESGYRYTKCPKGGIHCLDLDEEAPLPRGRETGTAGYRAFKTGASLRS